MNFKERAGLSHVADIYQLTRVRYAVELTPLLEIGSDTETSGLETGRKCHVLTRLSKIRLIVYRMAGLSGYFYLVGLRYPPHFDFRKSKKQDKMMGKVNVLD